MPQERIESSANPFLRHVRKLRQRKYRELHGEFLVEGIGPVLQAVEHGAPIEALVAAPEVVTSDAARRVLAAAQEAGSRVVLVGRDAFETVSGRDNPSGLAAVVRTFASNVDELQPADESLYVALHQVANPGNLGTIVRTVDAVGGSGVIIVGESTDPWHPTCVKASMGTLFAVPVAVAKGLDEVFAWSGRNDLAIVTTSAHAADDYRAVDYPPRALVVFGSEREGLPDDALEQGDIRVSIPMKGSASSLNLAVAAGVLLYEIAGRRP